MKQLPLTASVLVFSFKFASLALAFLSKNILLVVTYSKGVVIWFDLSYDEYYMTPLFESIAELFGLKFYFFKFGLLVN